MRREIPLFIIDRTRQHKKGECDFLVCTDKNNGFIAKIDYIEAAKEKVGVDHRISAPNGGISARLQIVRTTGERPTETATRTLLKRAMNYYIDIAQATLDTEKPSREDCMKFIDMLISGNRSNLSQGSLQERQTVALSLRMLEACKGYLTKE